MSEQEAGHDRLEIDNKYLCGSALTRVNLSGATFRDMVGEDMAFEDVNLTGTRITNANLARLSLSDVNLTNARIEDANLSGLAIAQSNLVGMTINGVLVTDLFEAYDAKDS